MAAANPGALVDVLDRVLAGLEATPPVDHHEVPEDLMVGWSFTAERLTEAMPTLPSVTSEAVAGWLGTGGAGNPPRELADTEQARPELRLLANR